MYKQFKPAYPRFQELIGQLTHVIMLNNHFENNVDNQLAIQTNDPENQNWLAGTGRVPNVANRHEWELSFKYLQPGIKNTVIEDYLNWLEVPVYRTRIMLSRERSCYSIHKDASPRLHLPFMTNPDCYFLLTDTMEMFHLPADGQTYWIDTRRPHTFLNTSKHLRLHLVMIVED
jgi:hypothetical protein